MTEGQGPRVVLFLTDAQRQLFAAWLEQEAATNDELAKQCAKTPGDGAARRVREFTTEAAAMSIVARMLRRPADTTFGGEAPPPAAESNHPLAAALRHHAPTKPEGTE